MSLLDAVPGVAQAKLAWRAGKAWIWVGCAVALLAFGFYCGHRWEKGNTERAKRDTDKWQAAASKWEDASNGWQMAEMRWRQRFEADEKQRNEYAAQAAKTLDALGRMEREAKQREAEWAAKFEKAKHSPDCEELLKETKCAVFSGY